MKKFSFLNFFFIHMEERTPVSRVYDIFVNFFGEENVDLQEYTIIVHFPKVTVTNENNKSVDITELWVRVHLDPDGTINGIFEMIRSEVTEDQFRAGYSHSHLPGLNVDNYLYWHTPCLGTGPIRDTITSLCNNFSEDLWNLFCLELSKYVTVESILGVPYRYLDRIGTGDYIIKPITFPIASFVPDIDIIELIKGIIESFIPYILQKRPFGFNYSNGSYGIAKSEYELLIILSNLFIEYYNSIPLENQMSKSTLFKSILRKGTIYNGKLCYLISPNSNSNINFEMLVGTEMFEFKGQTIRFNIISPDSHEDTNLITLLSLDAYSRIVNLILRTVNNRYGKTSSDGSDTSEKEHIYL